MTVVTRFAPSPTGYLHIGGARTALFNWLFARHHGGKFRLRIEDTDRARSTESAVEAIFDSLKWLELDWDDEVVMQFSRAARHADVAKQLLEVGAAYYCYCSPEELQSMREEAMKAGKPPRYPGIWRDRDPREAPEGVKPVIRLKAPQEGETVIQDLVQGEVRVQNSQLDDMILLRADGTPTFMLSVVVDDHDMGVTHVIRGDDHLTNAFRQYQIFKTMGWNIPEFAHIPLIHGPDGAKLSKRHGALGAETYREMGFLPEALNNYLLRLGWGHGDEEIISRAQAIEWFDIGGVGKSPSRFDMMKLTNLNGHYLRQADDQRLVDLIDPLLEAKTGHSLTPLHKARLLQGMDGLKQRAKTVSELVGSSVFYVHDVPLPMEEKAQALLTESGKSLLKAVVEKLKAVVDWQSSSLEAAVREIAETEAVKLGALAQPLRAALTGSATSPGVFEVMEVLGQEESILRIKQFT